MISKNRREVNNYVQIASWHTLAIRTVCNSHKMARNELDILIVANTLQKETNDFIVVSALRARTGYTYVNCYKSMRALLYQGLVEYVNGIKSRSCYEAQEYNVTEKGANIVFSFNLVFSRLVKQSKMGKFTMKKALNPANTKYLNKARNKENAFKQGHELLSFNFKNNAKNKEE